MSEQPADYDSPWKDVLDEFFEQCMAFFFPQAHAQIDWARGYEFLDKELQKITGDAAIGRRVVDKLVKVWLKSGVECWLLVHLEVQGEREPDFETRLYVYNFRSFDRFNARVATFAILTDEDEAWRPTAFNYEALGTTVSLQFSAAKLLDYRARWEELERNASVFAVVVMAHLKTLETRRNPQQRLEWKLTLTKMLGARGHSEREIIGLLRFLDWIMMLPEALQHSFNDEIDRYKEENKMPYVTSFERRATERGLQQGLQQGSADLTLRLLERLFGTLDEETQAAIRALPVERSGELGEALLAFKAPEDLQAWLRAHGQTIN